GEGDRDRGAEGRVLRVLGRQGERQEGIVDGLGRPQTIGTRALGGRRPFPDLCEVGPEARVDLHRSVRVRRRARPGFGAGPLTAGMSADSRRGTPTCTQSPATGCGTFTRRSRSRTCSSSGTAPGWTLTALGTSLARSRARTFSR